MESKGTALLTPADAVTEGACFAVHNGISGTGLFLCGLEMAAVGIPAIMKDMDLHCSTVDIFITETADFTDTETRRIHECHHGFLFDIRNGADEFKSSLLCRHKREILVEPAFWKLAVIPWLMEDIDGKEAELGNGAVDGAVGKIPFFLDPLDVITKSMPGNILRILFQDLLG